MDTFNMRGSSIAGDRAIKVNKKLRCVLLLETGVTGTNQSTVAFEIDHSCVQTSRHWEKGRDKVACSFSQTLEVFIRIQLSTSHTKKTERKSTEFPKTTS